MRLARAVMFAVITSSAAVVVACGGAEGVAPPDELVTEKAFWEAMRNAACDGYGACCGTHQLAFQRYQCVAEAAKTWGLSATVCSTGFAYDASEGTACLKEVQRSYAECREVRAADACSNVCKRSPGDKAVGEACESSSDCKLPDGDGWTICPTSDFDPGARRRCTFVPRGQLGESCYATCDEAVVNSGNVNICESATTRPDDLVNPARCISSDDLYCDYSNWTCHAAVKPGEPRTRTQPCQQGSHTAGNTCAPNLPAGSACSGILLCQQGTYCLAPVNSANGVCTPVKSPGEECRLAQECAFGCRGGTCLLEPGKPFPINEAMCKGEPGSLHFN